MHASRESVATDRNVSILKERRSSNLSPFTKDFPGAKATFRRLPEVPLAKYICVCFLSFSFYQLLIL